MIRTEWRLILRLISLAVFLGGCAAIQPASTPAVGPQSSWEEIRSTPGLILLAPQIFFGTRGVSVTDVCVTGDTLRAPGPDGRSAEVPAAGRTLRYAIRVGVPAGDAETSTIRVLFVKSFDIPACK
jgi:hypothetical protein